MVDKSFGFYASFQYVFSRLPKKRKEQFFFLFTGMLVSACFESVVLGILAFFASSIADPSSVLSSKYFNYIAIFFPANILSSSKDLIIFSGFWMVVGIVGKNSFKALITYWVSRYSLFIEAYFGEQLLKGFLKMPYKWHLTKNTADLVNAVEWRNYLGRNFFQSYLIMFNDIVMVAIMMLFLVFIQPAVSIIVIGTLSLTSYFIYTFLRKKLDQKSRSGKNFQLDIYRDVNMAIHGIKDIKISRKEGAFVKRFVDKAYPLSNIFGMQAFYGSAPILLLETIGFGMLFISIWMLLVRFESSTAYVTGIMTLLSVTAWKTLPAVSQILNSATVIRKSLPYINNQIDYFTCFENDDQERLKRHVSGSRELEFLKSIQLNNVSFNYSSDSGYMLKKIDFKITKGDTVGIIGTSGAGKSTLADLIIGLHKPTEGNISIDDQILRDEHLPSWLEKIGYVSQFPYIFDGTLAENIAFGEFGDEIDKKRVSACCLMASMEDFLDELPQGLETCIGERGVRLSGGQRQRVSIARALYKNPEMIIFDEATSSLDSKSEKKIQETIFNLKGQRTLILIAHRLSTIEECDYLIWIEKGAVKMTGRPRDVLAKYKQTITSTEASDCA